MLEDLLCVKVAKHVSILLTLTLTTLHLSRVVNANHLHFRILIIPISYFILILGPKKTKKYPCGCTIA